MTCLVLNCLVLSCLVLNKKLSSRYIARFLNSLKTRQDIKRQDKTIKDKNVQAFSNIIENCPKQRARLSCLSAVRFPVFQY